MPSVTFTYPDELQELVHNAACSQYGYLEEINNPEFNPQEVISESNPKMIPNPWFSSEKRGNNGERKNKGGAPYKKLRKMSNK